MTFCFLSTMQPIFLHPSSYIFSGPSGVGKTTLAFQIIRHAHRLVIGGGFNTVFILYHSPQPAYDELKCELARRNIPVHFFHKEFPDSIQRTLSLYSGGGEGRASAASEPLRPLLVVDDFLSSSGSNNELIKLLFSRYCHHLNLSVMLITQSLFDAKDPTLRFCHRNTKYLFVFQSPRDMLSLRTLVCQMMTDKAQFKKVMRALENELSRPRGYILLNFHPNAPSIMRFMTDVLSEYPIVLAFPESI